jgi:hypothetical protein
MLDKPEDERLALVLAARYGSRAARGKLGERAACPAVWNAALGKPGPIARNFRELAKERTLVCTDRSPARATEAQARKHVCRGCGYGDEDLGDQCAGEGPWVISSGYMTFTFFYFFVAPLPGGTYFYSYEQNPEYRVEAGHLLQAAPHRGDLPLSLTHQDSFVQGHFSGPGSDDPSITSNGVWSDEEDSEGTPVDGGTMVCQTARDSDTHLGDFRGIPTLLDVAPRETTAYSLKTRRERFTIAVYGGDVQIAVVGDQVHVTGEGCDTNVPLPADAPWPAP